MAECDILYSSKNIMRIKIPLNQALKNKNISQFIEFISRYNTSRKEMRLVPREGDTETEVILSMRALDKDIQDILRSWDAQHPDSPQFDTALAKIREALNIIDETQTTTAEEDLEIKTKAEELDKNTVNLTEHLAEFYGLEAFDIVSKLKQNFEDMLSNIAYYDINSGIISDQSSQTLNENIKFEKDKLFQNIVKYLQAKFPLNQSIMALKPSMYSNGSFDSQNYYSALNLFYSEVATKESFKNDLTLAHIDSIKNTNKQNKTNLYKALVSELLQDETFKARMAKRFTGNRFINLQSQLYTADHYSEYYAAVKKYVLKNAPHLANQISEIEAADLNILEAANSYTMLRHFDSLLKDIYGDQLSIMKNTEGYEADIDNKYSYHKDTAHERKGWQTSEDMGSEKHIAKFTQAVINMIRIYNYKTGEFLHRRADSTSLVVASRNLINAVLTKKLTFRSETASLKKTIMEFNSHILEMHEDPVEHLQQMLELLFEKVPNMEYPLVHYIENRQAINDYDLSVLKSLYDVVFNKNTQQSFYRQSISKVQSNSAVTQSLLEEMAGFVDRNITASYLETNFDFETGAPKIKAKKKFFNNKQLYKTRIGINTHVNKMTWTDRNALQDAYQFRVEEGQQTTDYTVNIDGEEITLKIPNNLRGQILSSNLKSGTKMRFETQGDLFSRMNNINLIEFRQKIELGSTLNEDEKTLYNILKFLDKTLDLGILDNPNLGLQVLYSYQTLFNPVDGFNTFLEPLLKLGMRAAYGNLKYIEAGENNPLASYLSESKDSIYEFYQSDPKSKLFSNRFNNLQYQIATFADDVLNVWTDAHSILMGEASKATTKDKQGNSIPNNSVSKLGGLLHYYLGKQWGTNTDSLLFVQDRDLIVNTFHDLEATSMYDESKSIKSFSNSELFFHAIFNKFWGSYLTNGTVIVQPTTYSDKTTFLNWELKTKIGDVDLIHVAPKQILELYASTIGETYQRVFESTVTKLKNITAEFAKENNITDTQDYKEILHRMTQADMTRISMKLGVTSELHKDYRLIKNKEGKTVLGVNELLEYNARLYSNPDLLNTKLNQEKNLFLHQLILNNCTYQVLDGNDTLDYYTGDTISERAKSRNPVLNTILQYFANDIEGRKKFMSTWVDELSGKLILAKQNGQNIITSSDAFNSNENIELNPFLEKFFYSEGLLSNNLRYSLTGFEINHPTGKKSPLSQAFKAKTVEDWNKLGITELTESEWNEVKSILDMSIDIDDIHKYMNLTNDSLSEESKFALSKLLDITYNYLTNTSQGTQFKRNVIIPATLQYCIQNSKDGITPKIKCAVIKDVSAPVYNYRGEHEDDIDSCDGNAKINPFQSILENKSLGSQAVGFVKKPIWHAYDAESGTAFLAKFATDTMTNEAMRMSLTSATSIYNLFKKSTNLQWDIPIDLTKSLLSKESFGGQDLDNPYYNQWFDNMILGGQRLFYENKYGNKIEILSFNKTVTDDGRVFYYTLEKAENQANPVKKYHIFYDETSQTGEIETSKHMIVDSIEDAVELSDKINSDSYNENNTTLSSNAHTINSLYELHAALGGIYCVDSKGNPSEFNNEVVVNFMNNVGWANEGTQPGQYVSQKTYVQPLKNYHIGYLLNGSAVKNGAKNINKASAWEDNSELAYFEVDSDGLGMQMNADHDIVNSELTEFSQVIAATSAYGYTFDQTFEIFHGLAKTAIQASEKTLKAVDNFIKNLNTNNEQEAISSLYDSIGRIVLMNQSIKDKESLTNVIMQSVQNVFNKFSNHTNDDVKIPFSDPNIYSEFISTLASTITKQSIKRKHPGSGAVMVPAYNMIQYFEVPKADGTFEKLMSNDVLKRARLDYKNDLISFLQKQDSYDSSSNSIVLNDQTVYLSASSIEKLETVALQLDPSGQFSEYYTKDNSTAKVNENLIRTYLGQFKNTEKDISYFMPSDIVDVYDGAGNLVETIDLNTLDRYYNFKNRISLQGEAYGDDYTFSISVTSPHNLRPSLIRWQYGTENQYDLKRESNTADPQRFFNIDEIINSDLVNYETYDKPSESKEKNAAVKLTLNGQTEKGYVEIVKDTKSQYYSINFNIAENKTFTEDEKATLVEAVKAIIPQGALLSTYNTESSETLELLSQIGESWINTNQTRTLSMADDETVEIPIFQKGKVQYMNAFDLSPIKNSYLLNKNRDADYRTQVQNALHMLHDGKFIDEDGVTHNIIEGSLENDEAELVMSNMYKDIFGIESESLSEILEQGESFFEKQIKNLKAPVNSIYDMAFLRGNGKHTLISIGNVTLNDSVIENPITNTVTNEKDEIVLVKNGQEVFEVGKWATPIDDDVQFNSESGKFESRKGNILNQAEYRVKDGKVQKRFDYVKRYNVVTKKMTKNGVVYETNVLYKVANVDTFRAALQSKNDIDAVKQQSSIIRKIYQAGDYKYAQINPTKNLPEGKRNAIHNSLQFLLNDTTIDPDVKDILRHQLDSLGGNLKQNIKALEEAKNIFAKKEAHKKWISFQDSLKFISSRIPAQTLQSFMAMKMIAWTENSKNMCYVSHFQTYLQGSDYRYYSV